MKSFGTSPKRTVEVELKLALHTTDSNRLEQSLARLPLLARRKASRQALHNTYFDTPQEDLNRQRIALRVRRVGSAKCPQWLQTLKIGGNSQSALSRRGEWEESIPDATLSQTMLEGTPWNELDPAGTLFTKLQPCFITAFQRTRWTVRRRDGSTVEVALDIGHILADGHNAPICELELELLQGDASTLFSVAAEISRTLAVLPLGISKAERGYALARNTLLQPQNARPPVLHPRTKMPLAAVQVLREMLDQFCANLATLTQSDDPEVVHQTRVAWRRFRSGLSLFKKSEWVKSIPDWQLLRPLLLGLSALRDLDVAHLETLPMLAHAYTGDDPNRQAHWHAMQEALTQAVDQQRRVVRTALSSPVTGATLLALTAWLEGGPSAPFTKTESHERKATPRRWAHKRIAHLREQFKASQRNTSDPAAEHRTRILAKRLRYGIEALAPLLPKRRSHHWYQQALQVQSDIGTKRDVQRALEIAVRLKAHDGLLEFLRGVLVNTA